MNQAIHFLEDEYLDQERQAIIFSALSQGNKLACGLSIVTLSQLFEEGEPLTIFNRYRWDIEEMAEKVINAQQDDAQGYYWLSK
ncbi:DUF1488 domain-containing protein [Rosenbergiella australiborealis]|uniref:DUF1488 domain-containing protein n=1 Tax=Rosenbergiella australiborealis TaxID=1544696 RepID=A0ABS5T4G1_9GAMM|nr:DUF1488 domain-containing protein [Rosenbergiella australiborealis]MBT0727244.1 DUF1488 domain-containing protein [Rosenbergiella australiborealis]